MKRTVKLTSLILLSLTTIIFTIVCMANDHINYGIILGAIASVEMLFTVNYYNNTKSPQAIYENFIKNKINTYDAVMVETAELPNIEEKNIVKIKNFSDLMDVQIALKKPIYFQKRNNYTVFIIVDNTEACVCIIKMNEEVTCSYEIELEAMIQKNKGKNQNNNILEEIDKTTIIKFDDLKSYKVSPIKKEESKEKQQGVKVKNKELLIPKKYTIKKKSILCQLNDNTEAIIAIRDIKDIIKTIDQNERLVKLVIETDDLNCVLVQNDEINLEEVGVILNDKINFLTGSFNEKIEYRDN